MSLNYRRDHIDRSVNTLPQMIWNDTKLSQAVQNGVKLALICLKSQKQRKKRPELLPFLVTSWANEFFADWSALSNYRALKKCFGRSYPALEQNFNDCIVRSAPDAWSRCVASVFQLVARGHAHLDVVIRRRAYPRCTSTSPSSTALQVRPP